jgi:LysR family transcriptional regulator, carnitine catabolism transcriptional activator
MNLTIRQLKIFVSLAHSLSFSRTATHFHLTQPRLSKIVSQIEEVVGIKLFERTTRRVRITPEGQALLAAAVRLVDDFDGGLARLTTIARHQTQSLSVAALPTYAAVLLPSLIASLQEREPHTSIEVHDVLSDKALDLLRTRMVDLAITSLEAFPSDLEYEEFMREHFVLVGTQTALARAGLATATAWSEHEINRMTIISLAPGSSSFGIIDRAFKANHLSFRPFYTLSNMITIRAFIKGGLGIGLLPELSAVLLNDSELIRVKLTGGPVRSIGIISRRNETLSPLGQGFIRALKHLSLGSDDLVGKQTRDVRDFLRDRGD